MNRPTFWKNQTDNLYKYVITSAIAEHLLYNPKRGFSYTKDMF